MGPTQARYVTLCQQLLAVAAVLAALVPATTVVTLDIASHPRDRALVDRDPLRAARVGLPHERAARVADAPVDPVVTDYQLTLPTPAGRRTRPGPAARPSSSSDEVTSTPVPVHGFGTVGVTWAETPALTDTAVTVSVRSRDVGSWSAWTQVPYDPEHGPDPRSREGRRARPGTDPLLVGRVGEVQVRAHVAGGLPGDLRLTVIDPGDGPTTTRTPAIDTRALAPGAGTRAAVTPAPEIYSRAQWGADESIRDPSSLHYGEVQAGFVHHTVTGNTYSRADVPAIIRSIYAYHVLTRGWSDIGYNFLIDKYGRIWEGRYGGVDRPVVGAHTLNYNDYAFAAAALGNFEEATPSAAMLQAYGALYAWKLGLHGVRPDDTRQQVGDRVFAAINGHRDAAATACPGWRLYDRLPTIRDEATNVQADWSSRERDTDLISTPDPDLLVRRADTGEVVIVPTGGLLDFGAREVLADGFRGMTAVVATPDVTGDGRADIVARAADGVTRVYPGTAAGPLADPVAPTTMLRSRQLVAAAGDLNRDGHNDVVARRPDTGMLEVYRGHDDGTFTRQATEVSVSGYDLLAGTGDLTGDRRQDLVARADNGRLWVLPGDGHGGFDARLDAHVDAAGFDVITGYGDYTRDGRADLFVREAATGDGYLLPGRGDGRFGHPHGPISRASGADLLSGGRLVGSRRVDLVGRVGDQLVAYPNNDGFDLGEPVGTGVDASGADLLLAVGDWDGDGAGDFVTRSAATGALLLYRGDGRGDFAAPLRIGGGFAAVHKLAAVGDVTGDGRPDLMGQVDQVMRIYPGRGTRGLAKSYPAYGAVTGGRVVGVGRWDRDGAPDLLVRDRATLRLYRGNGPGGLFGAPEELAQRARGVDWILGTGDVAGSSRADLVVRGTANGNAWLWPRTRAGLGEPRFLGDGMSGFDLAAG